MRLNKLKKKKGNLKRVVASFLAIATIGFQANLVGFASNITGITGNNGVYNINPSQTSGTTGYRQYTNFTLDNGHTANLIFNGINRFINAVDNKVTINGILNSVNGSGAFANGRAIFVSPRGFVVGSSGVVNVGSLGVYTPTLAAYNSFKNLSLDQMSDALLNGYGLVGDGHITIDGMILTREGITLNSPSVYIGDNAKMAHGFKSNNSQYSQDTIAQYSQLDVQNARNNAGKLFELIVNGGKNNFNSSDIDFSAQNGNVAINTGSNYNFKNATMVANGNVDIKTNNMVTQDTSNILDDNRIHELGGKTYVANDYNFESIVKDTFVNRKGETASGRATIKVTGEINAKNISIKNKISDDVIAKLNDWEHNSSSNMHVLENSKLNATNSINLENDGLQMIVAGDLNLDNYNNVAGAGINIINNSAYVGPGNTFGTYIDGNITVNNGDLNVITNFKGPNTSASSIGFDKNSNINVTNGNVYISMADNLMNDAKGGYGGIYLLGNTINIKEQGNLTISDYSKIIGDNSVVGGRVMLNGNIDLENGDVNITKFRPYGNTIDGNDNLALIPDTNIYNLGTIIANGNIDIKNEVGGIVANGTIASTDNGNSNYNGINIVTTENSRGQLTVGGKLTSDKNINIEHSGTGELKVSSQPEYFYFKTQFIDNVSMVSSVALSDTPNEIEYEESTLVYFDGDVINTKDLYISNKALIESKGSDGKISLVYKGIDGGVNINSDLNSAGGLDIINSGNRGIMFNNDIITAQGNTFINDTGIASININKTLNTGGLEIQNENEGDINVSGTINSSGTVLVRNNTSGKIDISGALNNSSTNGTTKIVNETSNVGGINVSGAIGARNETTITNKGDSLINISGDVVDNIVGIAVEQANAGVNGGVSISKDITTSGYLTISNKGQQGITLTNGTNTTSTGKTTIKDTSNVGINIGNNTNINAGSLAVIKEGQGGINMQGVVSSTGDTLVANYGTDDINISNTFAGGKTTIYNDVNGSDINISGSVTTNGDTLIVQGAEGALNITGAINNNSQGKTVISNVNGSSFNVGNMNTNGFTLIENSSDTDIALNGNINTNNGDLSIQNQNYEIAINKTDVENSDAVSLTRNSVDSPNKNGGIVANGTLAGNDIYIQNSGDNGILTNNNITASGNLMITSDNANINLQNGNLSGNSVIVSASNNTTGGINIDSNIISQEMLLLENAGSGNIIVNGNLTGNNGNVLIENQTYDIETPRASFNNDYIVLDVNRINQASKNTNSGIYTTGAISGANIYIQNSGNQGIEANSNITSQGDVLITNNAGSINLVGKNIIGNNITVSNSNNANSGITVGSNITAQNAGMLTIENAAPGSILLNGNLNANGGYIIVENQTYDIATPRVSFNNDYIVLDVNRINQASQYVDGGIVANGTINGGDIFIQNAGSEGIAVNNNITSDNLMITNDNGGISIGNVDIVAQYRDVVISNSNNATGGINIAADIQANNGDVVVENAGNGNIELGITSALSGDRVLVENQTYDIATPRFPEGDNILLGVERSEIPSSNQNGGIISNGNISGNEVYIQNSGDNGITTNGDIQGNDVVAITNNSGAISLNNGGTVSGNEVIISQSNQGTGGVTIDSNVTGTNLVLIENAGSGDLSIGGDVNGGNISVQNQTYDIETPQFKHNDGLITLDVNRIDQDTPNKDGGIIIDGDITGNEDTKIQNSGDDGIIANGDVTGGDVAITNNGGDVNINGNVDGDNVTISNSDNGGEVNINGNVDGNDVLVENNGSGDINNPNNVNGDIKDHEYGIETPRNPSNDPYITLDVTRNPFPSPIIPTPTPTPTPTPVPTPNSTPELKDNDPTRLIYDREQDNNFLELKRESIRYGVNGDSLSLNEGSEHIESIVDISKTGLAVKTDGNLKLNDEVKVSFAYKGIEVDATAKVMRVNQSNNIAGLKFTDLDTLTANKILYLSMLNEAQKEQTAANDQNQQPSFMNVLSKL